jgi:ABC-2 type transport system ATP-binding protein
MQSSQDNTKDGAENRVDKVAATDGAVIRTEGLVRRFGEETAVDGVDLSVAPGEIYGFLGPNGAGKTTTVRMLVTLLAPSAGRAEVAGYDIARDPGKVRLRIGVALQEAALDARQTGNEILQLQGRLYGLKRGEIKKRLSELGDLIDLGDALKRPVGGYSGGMKRRLDLATALVHNPDILFLDEPTTGLDPVSRMKVWEEVRRLNDELGVTIFLTTQYLEEADRLADRVGIIDTGRIVAEGTPEELKRSVGQDLVLVSVGDSVAEGNGNGYDKILERLRRLNSVERVDAHGGEITVTTPDGPRAVGSVAVALAEDGVAVERLTLRTPTLDDVFLEVTGNRMEAPDLQDSQNTQGTQEPQEAE